MKKSRAQALAIEPKVDVDHWDPLQLIDLSEEGIRRPGPGKDALHDVTRHLRKAVELMLCWGIIRWLKNRSPSVKI